MMASSWLVFALRMERMASISCWRGSEALTLRGLGAVVLAPAPLLLLGARMTPPLLLAEDDLLLGARMTACGPGVRISVSVRVSVRIGLGLRSGLDVPSGWQQNGFDDSSWEAPGNDKGMRS